jgi:peptide deformylase
MIKHKDQFELEIVTWPDPMLMTPCKPWDFENPPDYLAAFLVPEMIKTMAMNHGIGLAANQVGLSYRVMTMQVQRTGEFLALFNPEVVHASEQQYVEVEGCLSFPGVRLTIGRSEMVEVKFQDQTGKFHTRYFEGIDAKCFLHELDHLDGKTFKEHVSELKYNMALKKAKKNDYAN